jgi:TRAP-type uncharacterized transport system substrate-binding protein
MTPQRRSVLYFAIVAVVCIAALVGMFAALNPTPPRKVVMATGPSGSAYAHFARQYREILARDGIELELRASGGSLDNLARLNASEADVAFLTMGSSTAEASPAVQSLGVMFFEPVWVFHRRYETEPEDLNQAMGARLSIGPPGSRSNLAARQIIDITGAHIDAELVALPPRETAEALKSGAVSSAILATSAASPVIKDLLGREELRLLGFPRADAYSALFPALTRLKIPAGVGSLAKNLPPEDVDILAFTALLAVRADLHPAIQSLLLGAAMEIHSRPDLFHAQGSFPSPRVYELPLSRHAARYYASGPPFLQRHLPFWLAVLIAQILVVAVPLLGIVYPALRLLPSMFAWAVNQRIFRFYGELRHLEGRVANLQSDEERQAVERSLMELDRRVRSMRVPASHAPLVYALRTHINVAKASVAGAQQ